MAEGLVLMAGMLVVFAALGRTVGDSSARCVSIRFTHGFMKTPAAVKAHIGETI